MLNLHPGRLAANGPPIVSHAKMASLAETWRGKLNIKVINADAQVIGVSGGNQQRVVIAKSLVQKPRLVIFDEPTRGVAVGAIAEINLLIQSLADDGLADDGLAVLVILSCLPQIMNLSDRSLMARQGRIVKEYTPSEVTEQKIMDAAVHQGETVYHGAMCIGIRPGALARGVDKRPRIPIFLKLVPPRVGWPKGVNRAQVD